MINNRYQILKLLGEGRSKVFLALDILMNKNVALKVLPFNAKNEAVEFFREEFLVLKKLQHPNIIKSYDAGSAVDVKKEAIDFAVQPGSKFISLEYIEGLELHKYFEANASEELLIKFIEQISGFLFYLHSSNMIYSDLKPENILFDEKNGELKFIDFGFVKEISRLSKPGKSGTIQYLAPEVLSQRYYDHRADFYSFGILLYKLIYGKLPFDNEDEMSIYRNHLHKHFEFPVTTYSGKILNIVKKLLEKNPSERYRQAFEILYDLNGKTTIDLSGYRVPKVFVINNVALSIINDYLLKDRIDEAVVLKGEQGSGKSTLVEEIYFNYEDIVIINDKTISSFIPVWQSMLSQILYSDFAFPRLDDNLITRLKSLLASGNGISLQDIKSVFSLISSRTSFTVVFDDLDQYDSLTLNLLNEIIPILLVNNVKVIVVESEDEKKVSLNLASTIERRLQAFSEQQLLSYIDKTFSSVYPKEKIVSIIKQKSDLLPGSINQTLQNIFSLGFFTISGNEVLLDENPDKLNLLDKNNDKIFELRYKALNRLEKKTAQILSLFNLGLTTDILSKLLDIEKAKIERAVGTLQYHNILREDNELELHFTSSRIKSYIYGKIRDKKKLHAQAARTVLENFPDYDKMELARQFELAKDYNTVFKILFKEASIAEKIYAYSLTREILEKLIELPLNEEQLLQVQKKLVDVYWNLGEYKKGLELVTSKKLDLQEDYFLTMKGNFFVRLGEKVKGIEVLERILLDITNHEDKVNLEYEIASAKFALNEIDTAVLICQNLIENNMDSEIAGKSHNLLALLDIHYYNNMENSLKNLRESLRIYKLLGNKLKEAQLIKNIGNIYYLQHNYIKAEEFWNQSLFINSEIGSLEEEGLLHNNFGVLNFVLLEYEKAEIHYRRSLSLYKNVGKLESIIWLLYNFAEVSAYGCRYENAIRYCKQGIDYSNRFSVMSELKELYFLLLFIYYSVGSIKSINILEDEIKKYRNENLDFSDFHDAALLLKDALSNYQSSNPDIFKILIDKFIKESNKDKYLFILYLYLEKLIKNKDFDEALNIINSEEYNDSIRDNILHTGYKNYYLGIIYRNQGINGEALKYLDSAFELIENKSITELSWRVMFALAESYWERGDINRAGELVSSTKLLLHHIYDQIKTPRFKKVYFNHPLRKPAVEQLEVWENFLKKK